MDPKNSGSFNRDSFIKLLTEIWRKTDITEQLVQAFHIFDENNDGGISATELKNVIHNMGDKLSEKEIDDLFAEGDLNKDKVIDMKEFMLLMKGPCN